MSGRSVDSPIEFLNSLGNLHDVFVDSMQLSTKDKPYSLVLAIDDLHKGIRLSPQYPGEQPASIALLDVMEVFVDLELKADDFFWIGSATVSRIADTSRPYRLEIDVSGPGGKITEGRASIAVTFATMEIRDKPIG